MLRIGPHGEPLWSLVLPRSRHFAVPLQQLNRFHWLVASQIACLVCWYRSLSFVLLPRLDRWLSPEEFAQDLGGWVPPLSVLGLDLPLWLVCCALHPAVALALLRPLRAVQVERTEPYHLVRIKLRTYGAGLLVWLLFWTAHDALLFRFLDH